MLAVVLYFLVPSQVAMIETDQVSMSPSFYPRVIIVLMGIVSAIYFLTSFFEERKKIADSKELGLSKEEDRFPGHIYLRTLTTVAIIFAYIFLLEFMGFFIATPIGLGALMYHMGNRRIKVYCIILIIVPVVIYILFERVLNVILPKGPF